MSQWLETYRGTVRAWEIDPVEHFTVAFYFDRLADATLNLFAAADLGPRHMRSERHALATVEAHCRYLAELRAGDLLHIQSGVIGTDERGARIVHQLYNSATGELAGSFLIGLRYMDLDARRGALLDEPARARLDRLQVDFAEPDQPERADPPADAELMPAMRDTVKPWEIDVLGHMSLSFYVHRFSDANNHTLAAIGMSPPYMREHRIGFSTFEMQGRFRRELSAGDRIEVRSCITHVGNTSIRLLNRMYNLDTGTLVAELGQFGVHLDLDARRPSPLPDEMRARGLESQARAFQEGRG